MKKLSFLLALVLLVTVAGCRKQEDLPEVEQPPVEETEDPVLPKGPLQLETLRLEITRYDGDTELVLRAARELPDLLQRYFAEAETPVEIEKVRVTVGSSAAATAQSLRRAALIWRFCLRRPLRSAEAHRCCWAMHPSLRFGPMETAAMLPTGTGRKPMCPGILHGPGARRL